MAQADSGLFAIEVDADDYAETAAGDTQSMPRTFQSEADFQAQKDQYSAKIDNGNILAELTKAISTLRDCTAASALNGETLDSGRKKLSKKDGQVLGYAAGELYYDGHYGQLIDLCRRVSAVCTLDSKTAESLQRWVARCEDRLRPRAGGGIATLE